MKAILFVLFAFLLMVGCNGMPGAYKYKPPVDDQEKTEKRDSITTVVSSDELEVRGKAGSRLFYIPSQDTPFTGKAGLRWQNGQIMSEVNIKDGKNDGLTTRWYENGQKELELNWKDGKLMSAVVWKPSGEKCPETNLKKGSGDWISYNDDGRKLDRYTYKNGKPDGDNRVLTTPNP